MAAFVVVAFIGSGCPRAAAVSGVGDGRGTLGVAAFVVVAFIGSGCSRAAVRFPGLVMGGARLALPLPSS